METNKIYELMTRVYNNKMIVDEQNPELSDEEGIKALCQKTFGDGSITPDPTALHSFNTVVVQVADKVAAPQIKAVMDILAAYKTHPANVSALTYTIPKKSKVRLVWAASGSGVDHKRVEAGKQVPLFPVTLQTGIYYEPLTKTDRCVEDFRTLVNDIADAKVRLYLEKVREIMDKAIASTKVPAKNTLVGDNLTLAGYNKLASTIARNGGRPVFTGDTLLIDYFAQQQGVAGKELLTDTIKEELRHALCPTTVGRTTAVNLYNPFLDDKNEKVEYPVNVGYMIGSATNAKPFIIEEVGGLKQSTTTNDQDEMIKMTIKQQVAIELIYGNLIGYVKENTAVAL